MDGIKLYGINDRRIVLLSSVFAVFQNPLDDMLIPERMLRMIGRAAVV